MNYSVSFSFQMRAGSDILRFGPFKREEEDYTQWGFVFTVFEVSFTSFK